MTIDDPELLQMIFDKVGAALVRLVERMSERPFVGAIQMGDDMGFKTATMISPKALRQYVFPWQKKAVEAAHKHGKPFILHSCGNLAKIMDDLIANGIDAKHSFEDEIMPVAQAKKRWGDKIAILGGLDMDFLCRVHPGSNPREDQGVAPRVRARRRLCARHRQYRGQLHPGQKFPGHDQGRLGIWKIIRFRNLR